MSSAFGTAYDTIVQVVLPYCYAIRRNEAALGIYYYGARWYDPALGRFMQADSIVPEPGNPQSLNRYSYVLNNPMRYTDPSGNAASAEGNGYNKISELFEWEWLGRFAWDRDALDRALRELFRQQPDYVIQAETSLDSSQLAIASLCKFQADAEYRPGSITAGSVATTIAGVMPAADINIDSSSGSESLQLPKRPGMNGLPDHREGVNELTRRLNNTFPESEGNSYYYNKSLSKFGLDSTRRPDIVVVGSNNEVIMIGEVARTMSGGTLVSRELQKQLEYNLLAVPSIFLPLGR